MSGSRREALLPWTGYAGLFLTYQGGSRMTQLHCQPCPPACPSVFDRVVVSCLIKPGTRVMWELLDTFLDPGPLVFQLQAGATANPDADDWADVGLPVENQYFAVDPEQRVYGKLNFTHYRVAVTSPLGTYYSLPTAAQGTLGRRDWRLAREVIRQRRKLYRYGPGGQRGYLLKRRWTGAKCPVCTDLQTQESRNSECPTCYGTGFQCGYYYPMSCVWASMSPRARRTQLDAGQSRGTVDDMVVQAEMLQTELLAESDIWVNAVTDDRYYVHQVNNIAEMRGVALVADVELRLIAFSSIVYDIAIPEQLRALGQPATGDPDPDVEGF